MRTAIAAALVASIGAIAGPAAAGGFHAGLSRTGDVIVYCFPEGPLDLCPTPDVTGHYPGYIPPVLDPEVRILTSGGRFVIYVSPNVIPYDQAAMRAAYTAAAHCGRTRGERVLARIDGQERYAEADLASWEFSGICQ